MLLLQSRARVTAAELATELEVSPATARRDLEALSAAGVPVYPQRGRGGGWSLVGGARTDLSGLTAPEAQSLFLLLGPAAATSAPARAALRKLVQALPRTFRSDAEAAAGATVVDAAPWGDHARRRPVLVDALQAAVVRRLRLKLVYASRQGRSERVVDPWGLVDKDDVWYLVAGTDRGRRTFRVDRIVEAEPTGEPAESPDDPLDEAWQDVVEQVETKRSRMEATVLVEARFLGVLHDRFGRQCWDEGIGADGRARVRVAAPTPLDLARQLAGWGGLVEVLEPAPVIERLAAIGAELVDRYGRGRPPSL